MFTQDVKNESTNVSSFYDYIQTVITEKSEFENLTYDELLDDDLYPVFKMKDCYHIPSDEDEFDFLMSDINNIDEIYIIESNIINTLFPDYVEGV